MNRQDRHLYEFGQFRLNTSKRALTRDGALVPLTAKVFDLLLVLVQNSGQVIEKDELLSAVWSDTIVEEGNLNRNISTLRKALGEDPNEHHYIVTVPKRGYQFVAEVTQLSESHEEAILPATMPSPADAAEERALNNQAAEPAYQEVDEALKLDLPGVEKGWATRRRSIAATALVLLAVTIGLGWYFSSREPTSNIKSIAVLPLKTIGSSDDEHLGLGIADTLIYRLSALKELNVRSTSAVMKYSQGDYDAAAAGRALNVEGVLEGSIQQDNDRIRINLRLLKVRDGSSVWAGKFDEKFTDLLAVQDSISEQVTRALALSLTGSQKQQLTRHYTENTEAYQLYLKGRYFWNKRSREGYRQAIGYFKQAIEQDPAYALAYAGIADCYVLGGDARSSSEAYLKAKDAALKAIEFDGSLAQARAALGLAKMFYDWNAAEAEVEFKRAIEINPNYETAHQWYADCLAIMGRMDEAIVRMKRAQELDPLSLIIARDFGRLYYFARRYDEAIQQCERVLEMDAKFHPAYVTLGDVYVQKGMYDKAITAYQQAVDAYGGRLRMHTSIAYAYAVSDKAEEARKILKELNEQQKPPSSPFDLAVIHLGLGDKHRAIDLLEKAFDERSYRLLYTGIDPVFDSLRSDTRFKDLARRLGLK
jgi:DNA-binding winged helix-turn-helix (wHTH) protein/TolB-like protein/thioredoxin-like negative regulator of GroEL